MNLTRAFDTVSPDWLLKIISKFGCPSRFIARVRQNMRFFFTKLRTFSEIQYQILVRMDTIHWHMNTALEMILKQMAELKFEKIK